MQAETTKPTRKPLDYILAAGLMATILYVLWLIAVNGPFSAETNASRAAEAAAPTTDVGVNYGIFLLVPGIGTLVVAIYAIILAGRNKLPRPYIGQGMIAWIGVIFFQSFITGVVNPDIHKLLIGWGFSTSSLSLWDGLLVGAINALVIGTIAAGPLKAAAWRGAIAFGTGFGIIATLAHSLIYLVVNGGIMSSGRVPAGLRPEMDALNSNILVGLALVLNEAIFIVIYIALSVLVFYGIKLQQRNTPATQKNVGAGFVRPNWWVWIVLGALYYAVIMALTIGIGFGSDNLRSLGLVWPVTLAVALWAGLGVAIVLWLRPRFPHVADDAMELAWERRVVKSEK